MEKSFYNSLINAMSIYGDTVIADDGGEAMTYSALLSGIDAFAGRLTAMGVQPGERVALCAYNSCAWLKAFFGIIRAGAVAVLINYAAGTEEIRSLCAGQDVGYFLFGSCGAEKKQADFASVLFPDEGKRLDIRQVDCPVRTAFSPELADDTSFAAPAFTVFTSGTTGTPKGVVLTQRSSLMGAGAYFISDSTFEKETVCLAVPLFHVFGLGMALAHLVRGGKLFLPGSFAPDGLIGLLSNRAPDSLVAVMTVIMRMVDHGSFPVGGFPSVKRIHAGGSSILPIQLLQVEAAFGGAKLLNNYGQSETDACITNMTEKDSYEKRVTTVGKPLCHRQVLIMDGDGNECPVGTVGEITVKDTGAICLGYYKLPGEKQPIDSRGYLHTGDLGFFDTEGYLHLSGRIKDVIIKGGENIVPSELEAQIAALKGVRDVKVLGARSEIYGEDIQACITLLPGFRTDEAGLKTALRDKLPRFKIPAHFFIFDSFPLRENGKVDVRRLALMMLERLDRQQLADDMESGVPLLSISARSQHCVIDPLLRSAREILPTVGFSPEKTKRIVLCMEEMLIERAHSRYSDCILLCFELRLCENFLRVRFHDDDPTPAFSGVAADSDRDMGRKLIIRMTDRLSRETDDSGRVYYDFDYLYDREFDPKELFLQ